MGLGGDEGRHEAGDGEQAAADARVFAPGTNVPLKVTAPQPRLERYAKTLAKRFDRVAINSELLTAQGYLPQAAQAFTVLPSRMPELRLDGEPEYDTPLGLYGMKRLPMRWG